MLLDIKNLQVDFAGDRGSVRALDTVSLSVDEGETLCLVGESGSGKSVTALSIARLVPEPPAVYRGGEILLDGRDVLGMGKKELRDIRGKIVSYIFQEPAASLNPVYRVGTQILESLRLHRPDDASEAEVIRLLKQVHISAPDLRAAAYPHQLSGGMQQRVMIAMALASRPRLLVADEPTTALDVTVQAQIINLLCELKESLGMSILFITHNLHLVKDIADRVAVMYAGQVVESASAHELLSNPQHPYTRALLAAVPVLGAPQERLRMIGGNVPQIGAWATGCRFHPRCLEKVERCGLEQPEFHEHSPGHLVRCPVQNKDSNETSAIGSGAD